MSLHYNGANSSLSVNGTEIHTFNTRNFEIVATPLRLGNISKVFNEKEWYKMFGFIKKCFLQMFFGCNVLSINPLKCVSMNNHICKARP